MKTLPIGFVGAAAAPAPPAFDWTAYPELVRYDMDDVSKMTIVDTDKVSVLQDLTTNTYDASQATPAQRPTYTTGLLNGKAGIVFSGGQVLLSEIFSPTFPASSFTAFIVARFSTTGTAAEYLLDGQDDSNRIVVNKRTGNLKGATRSASMISATGYDTNAFIQSVFFDGSSSSIYMDGILDQTGNVGTSSVQGIQMGSRSGTGGLRDFFIGEYFYLAYYEGVLTATQHDEIGTELASIYGLTWPTAPPAMTEWYVSTTGSAGAAGTLLSPWDLASVLAGTQPVAPGDTVFLRGGTYGGGFTCDLNGTITAPIRVQSYPGETAIIDAYDGVTHPAAAYAMWINGDYVEFWHLEITSSDPASRVSDGVGPSSNTFRGSGFYQNQAVTPLGTKLIECVIHDCETGVGYWPSSEACEIASCILYNNGMWDINLDVEEHNIYSQNDIGIKVFRDNMVFLAFSHNLHIYGSTADLKNYEVTDNTFFLSGGAAGVGYEGSRDILIGGGTRCDAIKVAGNCTYSTGEGASANDGVSSFGLGAGGNDSLELTNNYFHHRVDFPETWSPITASGNTVVGTLTGVHTAGEVGMTVVTDGTATGFNIKYAPSQYTAGRGHITVYNWDKADNVDLDLSQIGISSGESYNVYHVCDLATAVKSGTYSGGTVSVPMADTTAPTPVGGLIGGYAPLTIDKEFGPFLVTKSVGQSWYVSPTGSAGNDGTELSPWDLNSVVVGSQPVVEGDTVWMLGGTYQRNGGYSIGLVGTNTKRITLQAYQDEKPKIDCWNGTSSDAFQCSSSSSYVDIIGIEIFDSSPAARRKYIGNANDLNINPDYIQRGLLVNRGNEIRWINLIIHDINNVGFWATNSGGEMYGCIIYNVGRAPLGQGGGHGLYTQNDTGTKYFRDNIWINQFAFNINAYANVLNNYYFEGNLFANSGAGWGTNYKVSHNFLCGGGGPLFDNLTMIENYSYQDEDDLAPGQLRPFGLHEIGYQYGGGGDGLELHDNYIHGHLIFPRVLTGVINSTGNIVVGEVEDQFNDPFSLGWTGTAPGGITEVTETGTKIDVRPNAHEAGRGHVIIFNWDLNATVDVDLSPVLNVSDSYEIFHIYDLDTPAMTGVYAGGNVTFTMSSVEAQTPLGDLVSQGGDYAIGAARISTGPEFGAFLVLKT